MNNLSKLAVAVAVLLVGCATAPETEVVYQTRCYHYAPFTDAQYVEVADWLDAQPEDSSPALMVEDYVRLREINGCSDDD